MPANYVKEVEPKVVQKIVKRPVKVQEKIKVMKTGMRPEKRKVPKGGKQKPPGGKKLRRTPSGEEAHLAVVQILSPFFFNVSV